MNNAQVLKVYLAGNKTARKTCERLAKWDTRLEANDLAKRMNVTVVQVHALARVYSLKYKPSAHVTHPKKQPDPAMCN